MLLVAETTALRYLIEIEAVHLLPALFGQVIIPPEVAAELQRPKTPAPVRAWMASPPSWLIIRQPTMPPDLRLRRLHAGEHDALLLIYEAAAPLSLTDDSSAYRVALAQHIPVLCTLRLLEMAAEKGLIDLPTAFARLRATTFYAPDEVMVEMLTRDAARKAASQAQPPEPQEA
jgi:predicted nucleic acid-binding protein